MCQALEKAGFEVPWPEGADYFFAGFRPLANRPGFSDYREACFKLIDRIGIGSIPGSSFYSDPVCGRYLLRFSFARKEDELDEACRRLEGL